MDKRILNLFENFTLTSGTKFPILIGKMPVELIEEIDTLLVECEKIKNHNLSFLREHKNYGKNSYQVSVPKPFLENSFIFAYVNHLGEYYLNKTQNIPFDELYRNVVVRQHVSHFDGYDFWVNYANENDTNPQHHHAGVLSGVIYVTNPTDEKTVFEDGYSHTGVRGDIIMFPAPYFHEVDKKQAGDQRITIAFNLQIKQ